MKKLIILIFISLFIMSCTNNIGNRSKIFQTIRVDSYLSNTCSVTTSVHVVNLMGYPKTCEKFLEKRNISCSNKKEINKILKKQMKKALQIKEHLDAVL